ncbi:hypothetical protein OUZ56_023853 [Daphnia magna]|uniref:Uncharacterized protein n=1 Tax=Daphnia magna TaxID=35525 RepID=A0ABR0AZN6_9CRUS|nr:hypothetical protein OUZ56_023853 [Daphnia magna]
MCGPMDKAPAYGAGDSRFDPWHVQEALFSDVVAAVTSLAIGVFSLNPLIDQLIMATQQRISRWQNRKVGIVAKRQCVEVTLKGKLFSDVVAAVIGLFSFNCITQGKDVVAAVTSLVFLNPLIDQNTATYLKVAESQSWNCCKEAMR